MLFSSELNVDVKLKKEKKKKRWGGKKRMVLNKSVCLHK